MGGSPQQNGDASAFQESPYLEDNFDYDLGPDSSFDFSFDNSTLADGARGTTAKSVSTENETSEKRSHPDDEEDEGSPDSTGGHEAKRRESTEKVPKKPGRKPLTSEPTSVSHPSPLRRAMASSNTCFKETQGTKSRRPEGFP